MEYVLKYVDGEDKRQKKYAQRGVSIESMAKMIANEAGTPVQSFCERERRAGDSCGKALLKYLEWSIW